MRELREAVATLREALDRVEPMLDGSDPPAAALEAFKVTIDDVRTEILAILTADDPTGHRRAIGRLRLHRAAQVCQNVIAGLDEGTITERTDGMARLRATAAETLERLCRLTAAD